MTAPAVLRPYPVWRLGDGESGYGLPLRLRKHLWTRLKEPCVIPWLDGLCVYVFPGNQTSRTIFLTGRCDPNEFTYLNKILRRGGTFIDVGANMGLYTLFAARRVGPDGVVVAIEPSSRDFAILEAHLALNHLMNVHPLKIAISDRPGEADLLIAPENVSGHNTLGYFAYDSVAPQGKERVRVERLDDVVQRIGLQRVDVIKMDIEGAELHALHGAKEILKLFRPVILLEVFDRALKHQGCDSQQLWEFLAQENYRFYRFDERRGLPVPAERRNCIGSENIVAVHNKTANGLGFDKQNDIADVRRSTVGPVNNRRISTETCVTEKLNSEMEWPKITLITPVLNGAPYIEQTIRSVVYQGYPNLEYIIVDGGSTDGTVDIIRKYEPYLSWWVSEPDNGMYDAINKGFRGSSGEIMGWISGTDMLHARSLFSIGSILRTFPEVEWITGIATNFNEEGFTIRMWKLQRWSRIRFLAGANKYIQQESTFWRRGLWDRAGGHVDASRKLASDFELWVRFFRHARLYSVQTLIGGWRKHTDSLGVQYLEECRRIHDEIIQTELNSLRWGWIFRAFLKVDNVVQKIWKVRGLWWHIIMNNLYSMPGPDLPPVIVYGKEGWIIRR
jgi:FkbM family methyltransferase